MTDTAKLRAAADLLLNATEISNQLRHLADNEIDSDSFAVVIENYNGRENEFERPITDLAIDAAVVIDELIAALEAAEKRNAELKRELAAFLPVGVMSEGAFHRLENSECRFIALWPRPGIYLPRPRPKDSVTVYARVAAAGINLETGGE